MSLQAKQRNDKFAAVTVENFCESSHETMEW